MENILKLVRAFIDDEYVSTRSRYDLELSDKNQIAASNVRMKKYFHEIMEDFINKYNRTRIDLGEKSLLIYKKPEKVIKRTLFQIKKYENPTCGDVIKRVLKDNVIYLCYTSSDEKYEDSKIRYGRIFVVANTNEGMKIITYFLFKDGKLDQPDDYEPNHITNLGTLVEKRKFQAPEEENSLTDYNAE